jgi:predicted transcriptional regulator of viral defense system
MERTVAERRSDTAPPRWGGLAALARRQHGVVAWRQLIALGLSEREIHTLIANRHLIRVHRGVYAVGHTRLSIHGVWMAAVLACGPTARLSHADASALRDLRRPPASRVVRVTAAGKHRHPGIRCHTTRHPERLGTDCVDGIPVTTLERTALDLAATLPLQRVRTLLEDIQRRDAFDMARFETELATANGHRGAARLRHALGLLADVPPAIRSRNEATFLEIVRGGGHPEPHVNSVINGEVVDFHWPAYGLVVELDCDFTHRTAGDRARDARIAAAVRDAGLMLRRVDEERLHDSASLVADVGKWLAQAARRGDGTYRR